MRSNSGLERFHRSSISQRSLSATSFRADIGFTELLMPRGPEARRVSPTCLGGPSWFGGDFWSMASLPTGKSAPPSLSHRPPALSLLLADDENSLHPLEVDSERNSHNPNYVLGAAGSDSQFACAIARSSAPFPPRAARR